jgi:sugar lactone lactonase YvrE
MRTLTTGLALGESPRWHEEKLWFVDMGTNEVATVDLDGDRELVATIPGMAMGIGWLPGGQMLIVSSADGRLLRRDRDGTLTDHADLSTLDNHAWGDMVVDGRGNAYAGCIGFDFPGGEPGPGILALITPDGKARQVAGDLLFPNGVAVTPDQSTLIIAESYGHRLTAFDIAADGSLANRRVWAQLAPESYPDGICLDAEGAVWYADVPNRHCVRVREGGEVLQTIDLDAGGFACALGGPQRSTLFAMVADWTGPESMMGGQRTGKVVAVEVDVPGVGWP